MLDIETVGKALSNAGLKEQADICNHSESVEDFLSYMQFDLEAITQAVEIVQKLQAENK